MGVVPASAADDIGDLRDAVLDVLVGFNVRTRTELQTRRALVDEQAALLQALVELEASATAEAPSVLDAIRELLLGDGTAAPRAKGRDRDRLQRAVGLPQKTLTNLSNRAGDTNRTHAVTKRARFYLCLDIDG